MRACVARGLADLNREFYRAQAASFSGTRRGPWPGWARCLELVPEPPSPRVLDVAAGNLRFARYLAVEWPGARVGYEACDSTPELASGWEVPRDWDVRLWQEDVVGELLSEVAGGVTWGEGHDLVACFGFFHHVPTHDARVRLLGRLLDATRPGGACCVSLWRFLAEPRLASRARRTTRLACAELELDPSELDAGDCLLGWQGRPRAWRYCHSFDEAEVEGLVRAARGRARVAGRFRADGRGGELNEYLVLRRA